MRREVVANTCRHWNASSFATSQRTTSQRPLNHPHHCTSFRTALRNKHSGVGTGRLSGLIITGTQCVHFASCTSLWAEPVLYHNETVFCITGWQFVMERTFTAVHCPQLRISYMHLKIKLLSFRNSWFLLYSSH